MGYREKADVVLRANEGVRDVGRLRVSFFRRAYGDKLFIKEEVVQNLEASGDEERDADEGRSGEEETGEERADRRASSARHSSNPAGGGALFGRNNGHGVGLPGRNIHLADAETKEEDGDGERKVGHQRDQDQENV